MPAGFLRRHVTFVLELAMMCSLTTKLKRALAIVVTYSFIVSCTPLGTDLQVTKVENLNAVAKVEGICELSDVSNGKPVHIMVIHGMASKLLCPGYSKNLMTTIDKLPDLHPLHGIESENCKNGETNISPNGIVTTEYKFTRNSRICPAFNVHEIYYVDELEPSQENLIEKDEGVLGRAVWVNRRLKHALMTRRFGDAIAYHVGDSNGVFRKKITKYIKETLYSIVDRDDADLYIVGHSLGSNIVLDVIKELPEDKRSVTRQRLRGVYLLANQHALIALAKPSNDRALLMSREFLKSGSDKSKKQKKIEVAAFTGRNDVLSYALTREACNDGPTIMCECSLEYRATPHTSFLEESYQGAQWILGEHDRGQLHSLRVPTNNTSTSMTDSLPMPSVMSR